MSSLKESVLVVEDDAALREALVDTLAAAGLSVLSAPDAPSALQLARPGCKPSGVSGCSRVSAPISFSACLRHRR